MNFKIGDVVVLKSGGPKMTVEKIGPRNSNDPDIVARCLWFDNVQGNEQVKDGQFVPDTLKPA
jgi:uncharacterized protein YodC (DUF2158 family)